MASKGQDFKANSQMAQNQLLTMEGEPRQWEKITHPKKRNFLAAFAELGNQVQAAKLAGVSRYSVYLWRQNDMDFAAAFQVAVVLAGENLESEMYQRAVRAQFPSDVCGIFLLKGLFPTKYRENRHVEMAGSVNVQHDYSRLTDEQLATLEHLVALAQVRPAEIEQGPAAIETTAEVVPQSPDSGTT